MKDGFIRCGCAVPAVKVADCAFNAGEIVKLVRQADKDSCSLLVFPELCVTGYTCGDLFLSDALLKGAVNALEKILEQTADTDTVFLIGMPVSHSCKLYNCAAVCLKGRVLGFVPKRNIPNYSEFYEARHFTPWSGEDVCYVDMPFGSHIPMGSIVFSCENMPPFVFSAEICEDLWVASPPSERLAENGALIICNLSASDEVIGKRDYRRDLARMQSARLVCGYIYADCGFGESTQDMVFSGHSMICENGSVQTESKPFSNGVIYADPDLSRLEYERRRMNTFYAKRDPDILRVSFACKTRELELSRHYPKTPFVPSDSSDLAKRCEEIITMQATGLASRLRHIGCKRSVIGVSGGLDSALALIVTVHAYDMLGLDRRDIIAVTMPCFGTTNRTRSNALAIAKAYGASVKEIPIADAVRQHFKDIGHSDGVYDTAYENSQARERTQVIMDIANMEGGIVIGTGDLSELALGWATYNGDHMSMYGVNSSVPKTLVRHLTAYEADRSDGELAEALKDVLATPVSPELLPPSGGDISQKTEDIVGPYELHDFFLYYMVRCGFSPKKILRIARLAFKGAYEEETVLKWLKVFTKRFFSQQFKRSCLPDGPKVGTVTLSPRGDWRMPSDACARLWLDELEEL